VTTPLPADLSEPRPAAWPAWLLRLLLASLLLFGSEILLWLDPPSRAPLDWALLIAGGVALSALLLDLLARFHVRDVFGLLTLAGIYGLLNGLLLNPQTALADVPRTILSRALGAHVFAGLLMLTLFIALIFQPWTRRRWPGALLIAALVGVGWGIWGRGSPVLFGTAVAETPLEVLLLTAAVGAGLILLLTLLAWGALRRAAIGTIDFRLSPIGWTGTLAALLTLLVVHLLEGAIDSLSLVVIAVLALFCLMILWFARRKKAASLLDAPPTPALLPLFALTAVLLLAAVPAYAQGAGDPAALIGAAFTAFGLVWLPALSLALGGRAFMRQAKALRL
jgi:hypothetical protein